MDLTEEQLNQMSEEEILDLFVDQLMKDKGMTELSEDIRKEIHDDLKEKLVFQVNRAVVSALPDEKLDELNTKLDAGEVSEEEMMKIVTEAGIDTDAIVQKTLEDFREVYLGEGDEAPVEESEEPAKEEPVEEGGDLAIEKE